MSKQISFSNDVRQRIKAGIDKATQAVAPSLGAVGMSALIDYEGLDPISSDDGVTILKNLEFKDKYENMGLKMLRKGALRTSVEGGDGTATTTVLAHAIITEAFKEISNDSSRIQEVRQRLQKGLVEVLSELSKIKREVKDEDIEKIANISSLDPDVAKLIADIIKEVGVNGVVTVERGSQIGYTKEIVKGAKFQKGLVSPYFINDFERDQCVLENPAIILVDRVVAMNEHIQGLMESIAKSGNLSVLWVADDINSIALASLIINNQQKRFNIGCVCNPYRGQGSRAKDFLFDLAALTGATVISEEAGMKLDTSSIAQCGSAEKVILTKDTTTIVGGKPSDALNARVEAIKAKLAETTSEYDKVLLEERLAMLTGGIGVIRVGAYTDTEFNSKKLKFENAINSTQAALQEGIIAGGGIALARVKTNDKIFKNSLVQPLKQQAENAGMDWHRVLSSLDLDDLANMVGEEGYDFKTKQKVNMFDAGIIDPYKVVRLALESAVSIASTLLTTEVGIVNEIEDKNE